MLDSLRTRTSALFVFSRSFACMKINDKGGNIQSHVPLPLHPAWTEKLFDIPFCVQINFKNPCERQRGGIIHGISTRLNDFSGLACTTSCFTPSVLFSSVHNKFTLFWPCCRPGNAWESSRNDNKQQSGVVVGSFRVRGLEFNSWSLSLIPGSLISSWLTFDFFNS